MTVTQPASEAAADETDRVSGRRRALVWTVIAVAGSIFAGRTKVATSLRGRVAPVLNERPGIAWAAVGTVFLLLVLWGGTHALPTWWGIALLGALLAIGVVALRHQTLRESHGVQANTPAELAPA